MRIELELNKTNRLRLARAFQQRRVDYAIDCVIEGQMGQAFADDAQQPTAFCIAIPPFYYFAGEVNSPGGEALLRELPHYSLLMPSPPEWFAAAQQLFSQQLKPITRYSFDTSQLSEPHLAALLNQNRYCNQIVPLDEVMIDRSATQSHSYLEIEAFDSVADFLERGLGYALLDGEQMLGVAYSSLVCSRGIEVSIYVQERVREQGIATALASQLLLSCLRQGMRPNWDAANLESYKLALKLGYTFAGAYEAYYYSPS